jgi:biopolymer transport protein ExbD
MKQRRRAADRVTEVKIEMTPMIDVVFLLLIFLLLATKPMDQLSRFATRRPAGVTVQPPPTMPLLTIMVHEGNRFTLNGIPVTPVEMDRRLARIADYSTAPAVLIKSSDHAAHGGLVQAMDICYARNFTNVLLGSF